MWRFLFPGLFTWYLVILNYTVMMYPKLPVTNTTIKENKSKSINLSFFLDFAPPGNFIFPGIDSCVGLFSSEAASRGISKNFAKFTGKTCAATILLITRLHHRCLPVNFAKLLRTLLGEFNAELFVPIFFRLLPSNHFCIYCRSIFYSKLWTKSYVFNPPSLSHSSWIKYAKTWFKISKKPVSLIVLKS